MFFSLLHCGLFSGTRIFNIAYVGRNALTLCGPFRQHRRLQPFPGQWGGRERVEHRRRDAASRSSESWQRIHPPDERVHKHSVGQTSVKPKRRKTMKI